MNMSLEMTILNITTMTLIVRSFLTPLNLRASVKPLNLVHYTGSDRLAEVRPELCTNIFDKSPSVCFAARQRLEEICPARLQNLDLNAVPPKNAWQNCDKTACHTGYCLTMAN